MVDTWKVGDKLWAVNPRNELWSHDFVATVIETFPAVGRMHVRWEHNGEYSSTNYSVNMSDYERVTDD